MCVTENEEGVKLQTARAFQLHESCCRVAVSMGVLLRARRPIYP